MLRFAKLYKVAKQKASKNRNRLQAQGLQTVSCIGISILFCYNKIYFTFATIALKASGWFIAKSARTLRFNSMLLAFNAPIN